MEQIFEEINKLDIVVKTISEYKDDLLKYMSISRERITINEEQIKTILIGLNRSCLIEIGGDYKTIQNECNKLFKKKNRDYGNSYKVCGIIGILVRIIDKINRMENLLHIKHYEIDESYNDTLMDLHNYTLLGLIC